MADMPPATVDVSAAVVRSLLRDQRPATDIGPAGRGTAAEHMAAFLPKPGRVDAGAGLGPLCCPPPC